VRLVERWPHGNQALDAASEACKDMCKDMHDSASSRNWPPRSHMGLSSEPQLRIA